jgi:glycosyltransferase involved in cell wall biosynthesis
MVRQAVLAALAQELPPLEVVVSDDRSPDDTLAVLEAIAATEPRLRIIRNEVNSGGVANWNKVIDAAAGEYVSYCSDDDYFLPFHLKVCVEYLEAHRDVDCVHCGFLNVFESPGGFPVLKLVRLSDAVFEMTGAETLSHIVKQTSYPFQPSTLVFRKSMWQAVGPFNPRYEVADTDWFIRAGRRHRIAYLPACTVVNRRHPDNWSNRVGSIKMNVEFDEMVRQAIADYAGEAPAGELARIRRAWRRDHFVKFLRIFVARSRAGLFDVSAAAATVLWDCVFPGRRGSGYGACSALMRAASRFLALAQRALPGGAEKYGRVGKECPK